MEEICDVIRALGIKPGDIVMVHSDLSRIGPIDGAKNKDQMAACYFKALSNVITSEGTVVALACTESFARHGKAFDYENSPSEQGIFSEYVRKLPGSIRSMHPLFSLVAHGAQAETICGEVSCSAFGWDSPFGQLHRQNGLILCIGVDLKAMTFIHYVEQLFGVPYGYTKEWSAQIFKDGKLVDNQFFAFVRYRDAGVNYNFDHFQQLLLAQGVARVMPVGYGHAVAVRSADVFDAAIAALKKDIFTLLENHPTEGVWKKVDEALETSRKQRS
jgi:aminoglycoside 3-N-acetyltransferase